MKSKLEMKKVQKMTPEQFQEELDGFMTRRYATIMSIFLNEDERRQMVWFNQFLYGSFPLIKIRDSSLNDRTKGMSAYSLGYYKYWKLEKHKTIIKKLASIRYRHLFGLQPEVGEEKYNQDIRYLQKKKWELFRARLTNFLDKKEVTWEFKWFRYYDRIHWALDWILKEPNVSLEAKLAMAYLTGFASSWHFVTQTILYNRRDGWID